MRDIDVRHLPVVEHGPLVGMVSDRDLTHVNLSMLLTDPDALTRELAAPVTEVMRADVICVEAQTDLTDVIGRLLEHKIGAPVGHPTGYAGRPSTRRSRTRQPSRRRSRRRS
jgi:CBS domain-containing protein